MLIFILTPDISVYLETILIMVSCAPAILSTSIFQFIPKQQPRQFWYLYLGILIIICISSLAFIELQNTLKPSYSYSIYLLAISALLLAILAEQKIVRLVNRRFILSFTNETFTAYTGEFIKQDKNPYLFNPINWLSNNKRNDLTEKILVFALIGILEEWVFRGVLLHFIYIHTSGLAYYMLIIVQVLIFGISHIYFGASQVFSKIILGSFTTAIALLSGSILLSAGIHAFYNGWVVYKLKD